MTHSYPEPRRLKLGLGNLFINSEFVGELKGSVVFNVTREMAFGQSGNMIAPVKAAVTNEEVTLEAQICDLKLANLRRALGRNAANDTTTATIQLRKVEQVTLVGTTPSTLGETPVSPIKVYSLDRATLYVVTTDYTIATNTLIRVGPGTIADGATVIIEYDYIETTQESVFGGGELTTPDTFELDFVHEDDDSGKSTQITMFRAVAIPELELSFNDRASGDYTTYKIMFRGLADTTKPAGKNIYRITEEG